MSTQPTHKLTDAQKAILQNLAAGRPWNWHLSGRSAHGGAHSTVRVLYRLGYMVDWRITEAGRAALQGAATR